MNKQQKPHKHAECIKAWADGAEIETRPYSDAGWFPLEEPHWHLEREYRIKPEPKPDVVRYCSMPVYCFSGMTDTQYPSSNLKLTWDGETGKLKAAEVIA